MAEVQPDKRSSPRAAWDQTIQVIPLDDDWKQTGPPIQAQAKDLSRGGIAFRQPDFLADSHAAVMLRTGGRQYLMLVHILRCREIDGDFQIAGRFVAKLRDVNNDPAEETLQSGVL